MNNMVYPIIRRSCQQLLFTNSIPCVLGNKVKLTTECLSKRVNNLHKNSYKICCTELLKVDIYGNRIENGYKDYSALSKLSYPCSNNNIVKNNQIIENTKSIQQKLHTTIYKRTEKEVTSLDSKNKTLPNEQKHENIFTIPNLLCVTRIIASPYLAHVVINNGDFSWALAIFMYAGATDAIDGWIARVYPSQKSACGTFLDPLSDKILIVTAYLSLAYVAIIPIWLTALVVSRDLLLTFAGCCIRFMSVPAPFTWKKYFDMSLPSAQVLPTTISKINTMLQLLVVATALSAPIFDLANHPAYFTLCGITAGTTFASAVSYAFSKSVYKFKFREHDHQYGKRIAVFIFYILFNLAFLYSMPIKQQENETDKNVLEEKKHK